VILATVRGRIEAAVFIDAGDSAMGKGDLRTRRGKIYNGSYGKKRPHHLKKKAPEQKPIGRR